MTGSPLTWPLTKPQHSCKGKVTAKMPLHWCEMGPRNLLSHCHVPNSFHLSHHSVLTKHYGAALLPTLQLRKTGGLINLTREDTVSKKQGRDLNPGLPNSK